MTRTLTLLPFLTLTPCGSGPGDSDTSTSTSIAPGTTTTGITSGDPACDPVWDVPFRTPAPVPCYGYTPGSSPDCYGCMLIRADAVIRAESDVVDIAQDPVSCSGGAFTQSGSVVATYDPATGELSSPLAYAPTFVEDDLGVCSYLSSF